MKLLIVAESLGGGLGAAVIAQIDYFERCGWHVRVAAPARSLETVPHLSHLADAVPIPATIRNVKGARLAAKELRAAIGATGPDVVHCHGIRSFLVARVFARVRASVTWHGSMGLPREPRPLRVLRRPVHWLAAALAQEAIAAGPGLGSGWTFLPHASPRLSRLSEVAPVAGDGPARFVFVGRLAAPKRVEVFIEAVALGAQRCPMEGVVVGGGPREKELADLVMRLNAPVQMLGHREDVGPLMASANALVLMSHFEAVAFVAQEAMSVGRPVIASPLPSLEWLIGDTGRFVVDAASLADALVELSDPVLAARLGHLAALRLRHLVPADSPLPELERRLTALASGRDQPRNASA